MNYTQMFANGGKTSDQELIKGIQKILGVDDSQMEQLLQIGINKYGSLEGIGQALSQATQGLTQNSSPEEVQSAVASVFQTNAESQMFKCGGKLQQLVSKFGKGGNVDCGCGGIKLDNGGKTVSTDRSITIVNPNTAQADTLGRYNYPSTNGKFKLLSNGERSATVWDNTGGLPIARYANDIFLQNHPIRSFLGGYRQAPVGYFENLVDRVNNRFDKNGTPIKQDGGVMLEQMPGHDVNTSLTRRQARKLAAQNKGYNGEQFSFAMANVKNGLRKQGLRGRDLRERAREIVAGISPSEANLMSKPTTPTLVGAAVAPQGFGNIASVEFPNKKIDTTPIINKTISVKPTKRGVVEVGNVDVIGATDTNISNNKHINHNPIKGLRATGISLDSGKYGIDGMPLGRIYQERVEEQPHITRTGRDDNGNYYEVSDGMAGINTSGDYYISRPLIPSRNQNLIPAGGGNFNWAVFKKGGKVDSIACGKKLSCGGKTKAKEGIKLAKCGKKVKK